ncbi:MAG: PHP domain-containing protein [Chlamydiia bacterium]|nr:PHP domain-containing protein [Chlamydiia bacterium]
MSPTNSGEFRADLHCHSTCSDGTCTPQEIVDLALKSGLSGLSITDHDTVAAFEMAAPYAAQKGLQLLPGVEFSSVFNEESVHILAYGFSPKNPHILHFCERHKLRRDERNSAIIELLKRHRMPIDPHELTRPGPAGPPRSVGRPHIAQQMIKLGYVSDIREAFQKYLGEGKPCYHPGDRPTVQETLDLIHSAGGVAIIAHPHLIKRKKIVKKLLEMEFDGIEAYYAKFPMNQEQIWVERAQERAWIVTGGSDFHGAVKEHIPLGASWTPKETFDNLMSIYLENCAR